MPSLQTVFDACQPRADVLSGTTRDEQFVADLARVVNGTAPAEYADAPTFFRHSYVLPPPAAPSKKGESRASGAAADFAALELAFAKDVPPPPDLREQFSLALEEE